MRSHIRIRDVYARQKKLRRKQEEAVGRELTSILSIAPHQLWRSATARRFLNALLEPNSLFAETPPPAIFPGRPTASLLPQHLQLTCNQLQINHKLIRCAIRNKHYIHPPILLTRARFSCRSASLHPRRVHALFLQILLSAGRTLAGQFRGPRFLGIRVTHQHYFRFRIALQAHGNIVQVPFANVVAARASWREIASAHFARLRRCRRRLHRNCCSAVARAVQFIFSSPSHSIDSRREP
jgi:hypothetical protein